MRSRTANAMSLAAILLLAPLLGGCPKKDEAPATTEEKPAATKVETKAAPPPAQPATPAAPAAAKPATGTDNAAPAGKVVELTTTLGKLTIELNPEKAPKSVANFLQYVKDGHYAGTVFHRVIAGFMIQGGGFNKDLQQKPTRAPVENEADNGLLNLRGTVAMARTSEPHSATSQFFVNTVDNAFLNHSSKTPSGWGYTVFGKVTAGLDVVDKIRNVPTAAKGPFDKDCPVTDVVITEAKIVK